MGGDKEYVSVCPRVVVNTPARGVWAACREARGGCMQKTVERPEKLHCDGVHWQKLAAFRDTAVLV